MTLLERDDDVTHVVLNGRLDTTGTDEIRETFQNATIGRERPAIVDLSGVDFLASVGIGLFVSSCKGLMKARHRMVLLNPAELVESVLRTSKLESLLPIARDLEEAIEILLGGSGRSSRASSSPAAALAAPSQRRPVPVPSASAIREGQIKLAIENKLSELKSLNAKLAEFLEAHGVTGRAAYAVNLAIDELVSNVIRYAYVDDDTHLIDVELAVDGRRAILRIADDGRPFDPRTGPALDLHAEDREVGGLGLILVLDMVDALCYRRVEDKNCVEVRVHLSTDVAGDELSSGG